MQNPSEKARFYHGSLIARPSLRKSSSFPGCGSEISDVTISILFPLLSGFTDLLVLKTSEKALWGASTISNRETRTKRRGTNHKYLIEQRGEVIELEREQPDLEQAWEKC